ncbi:MAG: hypothetical protein LUC48_04465 [Clostridiales bacterium]|nr:hypothetical protein [Clostridiales bacterium]
MEETSIRECGLYILSDQYFLDFPSDRHMWNKQERRPYFFAVKGSNGIYWLVPLSSQVEKYRKKMQKHQKSVYCHIAKVKGEEKAFLTGNVIPVTEEYIIRPFTVNAHPYIVKNQADTRQIISKVRRYLVLVREEKLTPVVDILQIEQELLARSAAGVS